MVKVGPPPPLSEAVVHRVPTRPPAEAFTSAVNKSVVSSIIEKTLINLSVIAQLQEGDKLDMRSDGAFVIQKPSYYLFLHRMSRFVSRWTTHTQIQELVASAEFMYENNEGVEAERLRRAIIETVHGFRNLQKTYADDALYQASIKVLIQRIGSRFDIPEDELL